jgi:protein-tyrosine-phosphatase
MLGFRAGLTTFLASEAVGFAFLVGLFYAGLCVCTTFIFLDRRENTFCVPMHCGSSMLSGLTAAWALSLFFNQNGPSPAQFVSASLIVVALLFLSPLHHFQRFLDKLKHSLANAYSMLLDFAGRFGKQQPVAAPGLQEMLAAQLPAAQAGREQLDGLRQIFLFVCSGNTCRSPIAANISNAEIAARLKIPCEELGTARVQAQSAGLSARTGAPMMPEAQEALRLLDVPVLPHNARSLTVELAHEVERIFCMTEAHRTAVVRLFPTAAAKTHCLDPEGDIEDPIGKGLGAYVNCARRIHTLVRSRLDEISFQDS